ncbi:general odorant-binding protein 56a [Drosophila subpulchrella]|uniref:general odorant-binding protein 56a n=1 Tax=Drosophila subpulchrella TaxID=1486046 RepID=UPI0018A1660F|nr:general odorant-binding protein 56a [Drosophila subpulchrella]
MLQRNTICKMRLWLISAFLVSLSVLATSQPSVVKTANECAKDNKVQLKDAMGIMMKYKIKSRTHNVKCFINCIFDRFPILDVAKKKFKAEDNQVCLSIKNDDKCEESFSKFECFLKLEKKLNKNKGQSPK